MPKQTENNSFLLQFFLNISCPEIKTENLYEKKKNLYFIKMLNIYFVSISPSLTTEISFLIYLGFIKSSKFWVIPFGGGGRKEGPTV